MPAAITKHSFNSTKADGADTTRVKPSDWNDSHVYSGADGNGQALIADSAQTDGAAWAWRPRLLSVQTTIAGNVGGGSDVLMTYTLPASTLGTNGQRLKIRAAGRTSTTGSAKTLALVFGAGSSILLNPVTTNPSGSNWMAELEVTRLSATTQRITGWCSVGSNLQGTFEANPVETLTSSVVIAFYGTDGGAVTDAVQAVEMTVMDLGTV